MSDTTYLVEAAKSGRSHCRKCRETIAAGDLRIGTQREASNGIVMCAWHHPICFNMPRKMATGADKMTVEDFVRDTLQDSSENGDILPRRAKEIAEAIATKGKTAKTGDSSGEGDESHVAISKVKKEYEASIKDDEDGEPHKKRAKTDAVTRAEVYKEYHKQSVEQLKNVLRWNKQVQTGVKDYLLLKVIDGCVYGRLARCPLCDGGRLKLLEDGNTVMCNGKFDEDLRLRLECAYRVDASEAPRWKPWYKAEPSKEEDEEMEKLIDSATGAVDADNLVDDKTVSKLIKKANKIKDWDLNSKDGVRAATKSLIKLFKENPSGKSVDFPDDQAEAMHKIGPILLRDKSLTAADVVPVVVKEFGFVEDKKEKSAKKEAAIEELVKNPKNTSVIVAFRELGDLYYKQGNRNAGASCTKVVKALSDLDYEVTEENAMGLSKGKTKVANIGKASAEKIYEFLSTGRIEKLDQKRKEVD